MDVKGERCENGQAYCFTSSSSAWKREKRDWTSAGWESDAWRSDGRQRYCDEVSRTTTKASFSVYGKTMTCAW